MRKGSSRFQPRLGHSLIATPIPRAGFTKPWGRGYFVYSCVFKVFCQHMLLHTACLKFLWFAKKRGGIFFVSRVLVFTRRKNGFRV